MSDKINRLNTVSWKRKTDGRRVEGTVLAVRLGSYLVKHDRTGVIFLVKERDITKECR